MTRSLYKDLQLFRVNNRPTSRYHASLGCSVANYTKLHLTPNPGGAPLQNFSSKTSIHHALLQNFSSKTRIRHALKELYSYNPLRSIDEVPPACSGLLVYDTMCAEDIMNTNLLMCRECALDIVVELLRGTGEDDVAVTFTGQQSVSKRAGYQLDIEARYAAYNRRAHRLAMALSLPTTTTGVGVAAYGYVPSTVAAVLEANTRLYRVDEALSLRFSATEVLTKGTTHAVELYWMLRNSHPPEIFPDTPDPGALASALTTLQTPLI